MGSLGTLAWIACGALGSAQGEAGSLLSFIPAGESAHVTLYAQQDRAPDVQRLERELRGVARMLGEGRVPKVKLFYYEHASDVAFATGLYVGGITYPGLGQIHSTAYRVRHEMVHLVASRLGGDPGAFFQEGLAVALGDDGRHNDGRRVDDVVRGAWRGATMQEWTARFEAVDPQEGYAIAGSFMRFLLERHGIARVVGFFRASAIGRRSFAYEQVFGETLEDTGGAWMARLFGASARAGSGSRARRALPSPGSP